VASALAGCAPRDPIVSAANTKPAGNWQIEQTTDRITGQPISSASITAPASHAQEAFPKQAVMQLSCFKGQPVVRVAFQVKVGSTRNAEAAYRFDEKPGKDVVTVRFVDDYTSFVIEDPAEVAAFVPELIRSEVLYIRVRSFSTGRSSVEFKLNGAAEAVAAAYAHCPVKPPEPPKPAKRKRR
jgi:hypothetical protein